MGFFGGFSKRKREIREAAEGYGLQVTEVERDLPTLSASGHLEPLERDKCWRYALPRGEGMGTNWTLLQRGKPQGAQLPNGYLFQSGKITPEILAALGPVVQQYDTGYFEFEGVAGEVAAFWDEDGGKDEVLRVYNTLRSLQEI